MKKNYSPEVPRDDAIREQRENEREQRAAFKNQAKSLKCSKCGQFFVARKPKCYSASKMPVCGACKERGDG